MADNLSVLLGLGQQNAQQTNPFLNPNTLTGDLNTALTQGREQQRLDLEKDRLDLAKSAQDFSHNIQTQQLKMTAKKFQDEQDLNDMLFPVQGKLMKYQQAKAMSALDLQSAQIDREDALTEQNYENQDKILTSRQNTDNFLTNQLGSYSVDDLASGKALADATSIPGLTHEDLLRASTAVNSAVAQQHVHNQQIQAANIQILKSQTEINKNKEALTKYATTFDGLTPEQQQDVTNTIAQQNALESQANSRVLQQAGQPGMRTSIKTDAKGGRQITVAPSKYGTGEGGKNLGMTENQYAKEIDQIKKDSQFQGEYGGLGLKQQEIKAREVLKQRLGLQQGSDGTLSTAAPVDDFFNSVGIQ